MDSIEIEQQRHQTERMRLTALRTAYGWKRDAFIEKEKQIQTKLNTLRQSRTVLGLSIQTKKLRGETELEALEETLSQLEDGCFNLKLKIKNIRRKLINIRHQDRILEKKIVEESRTVTELSNLRSQFY